ncbi:hypothetical protein JGC56_17275 [Salmonella enterica subsp. enterica serovar Saintpaul]|nr:hypothetical protein [Salmonella enterica subsp. enterica serovar Saintpaul]
MKLNSKSCSAGDSPGTVAKSGNRPDVVVLIPAHMQGFGEQESGYVY